MKIVHIADTHLGFRQFDRQTSGGFNQREADVAESFRRVVDKVIELRPALVVIAGDIFHVPRPSNTSLILAQSQILKLRRALPETQIVIVAGNHDIPRSETDCILGLFVELGVTVVAGAARRVAIPALDLSILAVPDRVKRPPLEPDGASKYNVLLLHGEIAGVIPHTKDGITEAELGAANWNYVALGHYHIYHKVADNAYYAGSIDFTSSNPWEELPVAKGIIEQDLETGAHTFHALPPARKLVDIPPIQGRELAPAALDEAVRLAVDAIEGGIEGKVVRVILRDVERHVAREMDYKALRTYKRRALNFNLDIRKPERAETYGSGTPAVSVRGGRRPSLALLLAEALTGRSLADDVDRDKLIALGQSYLDQASADDIPSEETKAGAMFEVT